MTNTKPPPIEGETRERVAGFFPEALRRALDSYKDFVEGPSSAQAKDFKEHHLAAKVAISHIELLIRLGEWAKLGDKKEAEEDALLSLMEEAEAEIKAYRGEEEE